MTRFPSRRRLGRRAALVGGLAVAATALTAPAHAAPSVSDATLDAPSSVEVGALITVTVAAAGAVDLYAYDLAVSYDPDLVELVEDSVVTPDGGFSDVADDAAGTVSVTHTRLGTSPDSRATSRSRRSRSPPWPTATPRSPSPRPPSSAPTPRRRR